MSMFKETKEMIDATIYENGNGEITAQNVNLAMHGMLDAVETEVEAVKDKVAEIEENGVGGGGMYELKVGASNDGIGLTEEELQSNANLYKVFNAGTLNKPICIRSSEGVMFANMIARGTIADGSTIVLIDFLLITEIDTDGFMKGVKMTFVLNEDGSINLF